MERGSLRYPKNWLRKESRTHAMVPSVHILNVTVGREGSSVTGTVRATCSMGEFSPSPENRSEGDGVREPEASVGGEVLWSF